MKKIIFTILLSLLIASPFFVFAIKAGDRPTFKDLGVPDSPINTPDKFLMIMLDIAKVFYFTFFVVAFIFIILAAFSYLTAGDDTEKVKTAHKQLTYAAIAIAVALISVGASTIIELFLHTN